MKINNRRYLGNKYKLLPFIKKVVKDECREIKTIFDVFAGTGAVSSAFINKTIITNDILYSNHMAHIAWFLNMPYDKQKLRSLIKKYNLLNEIHEANYMSENFSGTYFSEKTCKKIGYIRADIERRYLAHSLNKKEHAMLIIVRN